LLENRVRLQPASTSDAAAAASMMLPLKLREQLPVLFGLFFPPSEVLLRLRLTPAPLFSPPSLRMHLISLVATLKLGNEGRTKEGRTKEERSKDPS
jgi:hypothetical protein